jgi:hypothetical protein
MIMQKNYEIIAMIAFYMALSDVSKENPNFIKVFKPETYFEKAKYLYKKYKDGRL